MKIAVPTTTSNTVDSHFGHCEYFTVFTIGDHKNILNSEILPSPQGCGCKSNIAGTLKEMGVKIMLAGNMGGGAVNVLSNHGIDVFRGCSGNVTQLVETYLQGKIGDSGETCNHHDHHDGEHQCNH